MAGNRSEKCPRSGITLQASALRVMCRSQRAAQGNEIRVNEQNALKITPSDVTSVNIFKNFGISTPRVHAPRLPVRSQLGLWATPGAHT